LFATAFALLLIAAVAIPLAVLSKGFDDTASKTIEGVSKIVAGVSLLQLSLKIPKWLGVYGSRKSKKKVQDDASQNNSEPSVPPPRQRLQDFFQKLCKSKSDEVTDQIDEENQAATDQESDQVDDGLTLRSIYFNVAWNIWREVAECGVFLIPFFLSGDGIIAIPLSAVIGFVVGLFFGVGIYVANKRLQNKTRLAVFAVLLLVFLSAGLFSGGCHVLEVVLGETPTVWKLHGDVWNVNRLPMTVFKPFGYNDSRTVLEMICFWGWLALSGLLHYRKYRISPKGSGERDTEREDGRLSVQSSFHEGDTVEMGDSSLEGGTPTRSLVSMSSFEALQGEELSQGEELQGFDVRLGDPRTTTDEHTRLEL
jgi:hypothetical protein